MPFTSFSIGGFLSEQCGSRFDSYKNVTFLTAATIPSWQIVKAKACHGGQCYIGECAPSLARRVVLQREQTKSNQFDLDCCVANPMRDPANRLRSIKAPIASIGR